MSMSLSMKWAAWMTVSPFCKTGCQKLEQSPLLDIHSLKEMTFLYPEVFQKFNVTPPSGILFHSPPGTGKTSPCQSADHKLLFRCAINMCTLPFCSPASQQLISVIQCSSCAKVPTTFPSGLIKQSSSSGCSSRKPVLCNPPSYSLKPDSCINCEHASCIDG